MALDPCQLPANYTTKITSVKRFIVQKIDEALGTIYDPLSISLTVDFGILTVNNLPIDGLTNKVKQIFGQVSDPFIAQVKIDSLLAAENDYLTAQWTSISLNIVSAQPQFLNVLMAFTGTCPL